MTAIRVLRAGLILVLIGMASSAGAQSTDLKQALETAYPLLPEVEQEILSLLANVLGADPIVSHSVNPDLIAGFVIRVGDRVYDGSVRSRLEAMRKGMVARATEAIQTNPERFFSTTA